MTILPALLAIALTVEPNGLTMDGALAKIRAARAAGDASPATVTVRGVNRVAKPVRFTAADHDVDFVGEDGATVSGGVPLTGWKDVGAGVWEADAPRNGAGEPVFFDQLWVNGRRASCARLPSEGWLKFTAASQTVSTVAGAKYVERVTFDDERVKCLADVPKADWPYLEVGVICKWCYGLRTLDGYDAEKNVVEMRTDFPWQSWKLWKKEGVLIAFFNVRSAFDAPGEWFYDVKAGEILYRPRRRDDGNAAGDRAEREAEPPRRVQGRSRQGRVRARRGVQGVDVREQRRDADVGPGDPRRASRGVVRGRREGPDRKLAAPGGERQ